MVELSGWTTLTEETTMPTTKKDWLTTKQAAEYAQCSVAVLYTAIKRGRLRASTMNGGNYRFLHEWIDAWLEASAPEIVSADAGLTRM